MTLLADVKPLLRVSAATTAFDTELQDLISAAIDDLKLAGVTAEKAADDTDSLIRRAVFTYVKANFGWDNPDAERLQTAYNLLKMHLTLSQEYSTFTVAFTVTSGGNPLEDVTITFNGEEKITNAAGQAVFTGVRALQNMAYTVTLDGYRNVSDEVDIAGSTAVAVIMEAV